MPRLTNAVTGVTVSVDEETAANLDANFWKPAKEESKTSRTRKSD
jgi:hypothetical protein